MLILKTKQYEVEETIKIEDEKTGETLYEMQMQITPSELQELNKIILDKKSIDLSRKSMKATDEEKESIEDEIIEIALKNQDRFEDIVFKDKRKEFFDKVGEFYYNKTLEEVYSFFWKAFIENKTRQSNTMISDLRKIGNN